MQERLELEVVLERLELEVVFCIVITDILNHAIEALLVVRQQSLLNVVAKQVTEKTTEILMTWIREERTAIGQHTYETAEKTKYGECVHLSCHAVELVVEPPTATELD